MLRSASEIASEALGTGRGKRRVNHELGIGGSQVMRHGPCAAAC